MLRRPSLDEPQVPRVQCVLQIYKLTIGLGNSGARGHQGPGPGGGPGGGLYFLALVALLGAGASTFGSSASALLESSLEQGG